MVLRERSSTTFPPGRSIFVGTFVPLKVIVLVIFVADERVESPNIIAKDLAENRASSRVTVISLPSIILRVSQTLLDFHLKLRLYLCP